MDVALTFSVLLRCWCLCSLMTGHQTVLSVLFSPGTQLLVVTEDGLHQDRTPGPRLSDAQPSIQVLSSRRPAQDPESVHVLVCLLTGLHSPVQDVLWWVDDTAVETSHVWWSVSETGGASATLLWDVSAADWTSSCSVWCGTVQGGQVFRERACRD